MALVVQKFGGTSVADPQKILAAARKAIARQQAGHVLRGDDLAVDVELRAQPLALELHRLEVAALRLLLQRVEDASDVQVGISKDRGVNLPTRVQVFEGVQRLLRGEVHDVGLMEPHVHVERRPTL